MKSIVAAMHALHVLCIRCMRSFVLTVLQHQLWQSVDGVRGSQPFLVPAFCILVPEEGRDEGIIKTAPSVPDCRLRLRSMMLLVMMLVVMIQLMKV